MQLGLWNLALESLEVDEFLVRAVDGAQQDWETEESRIPGPKTNAEVQARTFRPWETCEQSAP
jgi:hypothetical protein